MKKAAAFLLLICSLALVSCTGRNIPVVPSSPSDLHTDKKTSVMPADAGPSKEEDEKEKIGTLPETAATVSTKPNAAAPVGALAGDAVKPDGIELVGATHLYAQTVCRYFVKTKPADCGEVFVYTSSNPSVCEISSDGIAKPKKPGTVKISAFFEDGSIADSMNVTVHHFVRSISLTSYTAEMTVGQTFDFACTLLPEGKENSGVYWVDEFRSSNIISIETDGMICHVTANNPGEACMTIGSNDFPDSLIKTIYFTVKEGS